MINTKMVKPEHLKTLSEKLSDMMSNSNSKFDDAYEEPETTGKTKKIVETVDNQFCTALMSGKLKSDIGRGPFKMFCTDSYDGKVDLAVCEWTGNHWRTIDEQDGQGVVANWLRINPKFKDKLSQRNFENIWSMAKTEMHNNNFAITGSANEMNCLDNITFPTKRHYITINNGKFIITSPEKDLNLRYFINIDLTPYEHTFIKNDDGDIEYFPTTQSKNNYFNTFIKDMLVDDETIKIVQEFVGASFFKTSFQKCLWLFGQGSNGKGTLQRLIKNLIGPGTRTTDLSRLSKDPFSTQPLLGAQVVFVAEVEQGKDVLPESLLKQLIGGDEMSVNRKGTSYINNCFTGKWFISSQIPPHFEDTSDGIHRRFCFIEIKNRVTQKDIIINFENKIIAEDMLCFFDWTLIGAMNIANRGNLTSENEYPQKVKNSMNLIRWNNNSVEQWLNTVNLEATDINYGKLTARSDVLTSYENFCSEELHQLPYKSAKFWGELKRHFKCDFEILQKKRNGKNIPCSRIEFLSIDDHYIEGIDGVPFNK